MTEIVTTSQLITADFVDQLNTNFETLDAAVDAMQAGSFTNVTAAGTLDVTGNTSLGGTTTVTSSSASALAVGLTGATDPAFQVDASTPLQAAGLKVTGAIAAGTVAAAVISSGADANLTVSAKGTGTIGIGSGSTGRVTITPVTTITGALTLTNVGLVYDAKTLTGSTGTGKMVLDTSPTLASPALTTPALGTVASGNVTACTGAVAQVVSTITGALATGTTTIPYDDTIPQITEGDQYMTLAITPRSATSKLLIEVVWCGASSVNNNFVVALFQDATANALAVVESLTGAIGGGVNMYLKYVMTSGTTSSTTFRVRAGGNGAGTTTFNGQGGARLYGGTSASSIVITEVM
jgi:hypothetical protein